MDYEFKMLALKYETLKELLTTVVNGFVKDHPSKVVIEKAIELIDKDNE